MANAEEGQDAPASENPKSLGRKIRLISPPMSEEFKISNQYYDLEVQLFLENVSHYIK